MVSPILFGNCIMRELLFDAIVSNIVLYQRDKKYYIISQKIIILDSASNQFKQYIFSIFEASIYMNRIYIYISAFFTMIMNLIIYILEHFSQ